MKTNTERLIEIFNTLIRCLEPAVAAMTTDIGKINAERDKLIMSTALELLKLEQAQDYEFSKYKKTPMPEKHSSGGLPVRTNKEDRAIERALGMISRANSRHLGRHEVNAINTLLNLIHRTTHKPSCV